MFDFLAHFLEEADHKAIYVLTLICIAMIIDFISGSLSARINPTIRFTSKIGINGILRKIASMVLLIFFIPLAPLIPGGAGIGLLYVLYVGYLLMELKSIFENYKKMGVDIKLFDDFLQMLKRNEEDKDE